MAGIVGAIGVAVQAFTWANALRDRIQLVRLLPHVLYAPRGLIPHRWSQVASEKAAVAAALVEYERDISLLESSYNEHKALLDHRCLDIDLKELEQCALSCPLIQDSTDGAQNRTGSPSIAAFDQSGSGKEGVAEYKGAMES
jgi:hypothetical protein